MSSRAPALPQGPTSINASITISTIRTGAATITVARMTIVESRGPVYDTLGEELPTDGTEVVTDGGRWSHTEVRIPEAGAGALVIMASTTSHRASVLPAGPDRRRLARCGALEGILAAALDGKVAS